MTVVAIAAMCSLAAPAQAQFKNLGKSLSKAAKNAGNEVASAAGDMASDMAANKVSGKVAEFMDKNNTVSDANSDYSKRLTTLVKDKYTSVDGLTLNYKVYENAEANIIALSEGSIRVYSGMMDILSDDELLAVIATQIGHISNKDVRNNLMKVTSDDNTEKATGAQLEKMLAFSGDKLGSVINELLQVPYSDDQNKAADTYAYNLLKKSGNKTTGLVSALQKFAEMEATDATADENGTETSVAAKFIGVNSNNSMRASLVSSK